MEFLMARGKMSNILVFRGKMAITETREGKVSNMTNYRGEMIISLIIIIF